MTALAWVVAFGIVAYFMYKSPKFRKYFAIGLGCLIAASLTIGGTVWYFSNLKENKEKSLINVDQLELTDLTLGQQYSSWGITGKIKNNSSYILEYLILKVTAYDCPTDVIDVNCEIVGEDDGVHLSVTVPPGQLRKIGSGYVSFFNMPTVKNKFVWSYEVLEIKGSK